MVISLILYPFSKASSNIGQDAGLPPLLSLHFYNNKRRNPIPEYLNYEKKDHRSGLYARITHSILFYLFGDELPKLYGHSSCSFFYGSRELFYVCWHSVWKSVSLCCTSLQGIRFIWNIPNVAISTKNTFVHLTTNSGQSQCTCESSPSFCIQEASPPPPAHSLHSFIPLLHKISFTSPPSSAFYLSFSLLQKLFFTFIHSITWIHPIFISTLSGSFKNNVGNVTGNFQQKNKPLWPKGNGCYAQIHKKNWIVI